jgi:hypothetical protein
LLALFFTHPQKWIFGGKSSDTEMHMSTKEDHIDDMMSVFEDEAFTQDNVGGLHVLRADGVENYLFVHYGHPVVHLLWDWEESEEPPLRDIAVMDGTWLKMDTRRFNHGCELWKAACGAPSRSMALLRVFRRVERLAEQEGRARRHPHIDNDDGTTAPGLCLIM